MKTESKTYYAVCFKGAIADVNYIRGGVSRKVKAIFHDQDEAIEYLEYLNAKGEYRIAEVKVK